MYAYVSGDPVNGTDPTGLCSASRINTESGSICFGTGGSSGPQITVDDIGSGGDIGSEDGGGGVPVDITTGPLGVITGITFGSSSGGCDNSSVGGPCTVNATRSRSWSISPFGTFAAWNTFGGGNQSNLSLDEILAQRDLTLDELANEISQLTTEQRQVEWGGAAYFDGYRVRSSGLLEGEADYHPALQDFLFEHYSGILGSIHNHPISGSPSGFGDRQTHNQISFYSGRLEILKGTPAICLIWNEGNVVTSC